MVGRKKSESAEIAEDQQSRVFGFRAAHVFDISQTDGEPLAEFAQVQGDPHHFTAKLKAMIGERGIVLDYSETIAPAKGMASTTGITLLPGMNAAEEFAVLVHEFAHRLLHFGERRARTSKTIRETEAEAVAFVVSQTIGLECGTASADYIALYDGDKATLSESLGFIQRTAAEILAGIEAG
jgi:hypothetical protein